MEFSKYSKTFQRTPVDCQSSLETLRYTMGLCIVLVWDVEFDRSSITLDRVSISKDLPRTCFIRMQNREAANNADFCSRCAVPSGDKSNSSGSQQADLIFPAPTGAS